MLPMQAVETAMGIGDGLIAAVPMTAEPSPGDPGWSEDFASHRWWHRGGICTEEVFNDGAAPSIVQGVCP